MNTYRILAALPAAVALAAIAPAGASTVLSGSPSFLRAPGSVAAVPLAGSNANPSVSLLNSAGFIQGNQVFSDAVSIPAAGTLTVKLAGISWLDALQNLNCFVSAPGGGILGNGTNGGLDTVNVQPGTLYVNWGGQATAPLFLGAYSLSVSFQPNAPPPPTVPLPPGLLLGASGLVALALIAGRRRSTLVPAVGPLT